MRTTTNDFMGFFFLFFLFCFFFFFPHHSRGYRRGFITNTSPGFSLGERPAPEKRQVVLSSTAYTSSTSNTNRTRHRPTSGRGTLSFSDVGANRRACSTVVVRRLPPASALTIRQKRIDPTDRRPTRSDRNRRATARPSMVSMVS